MNLDFRKLTLTEATQAINNMLNQDKDLTFLAYVMQNQSFDVWGWFDIASSNEGSEYWVDLKARVNK